MCIRDSPDKETAKGTSVSTEDESSEDEDEEEDEEEEEELRNELYKIRQEREQKEKMLKQNFIKKEEEGIDESILSIPKGKKSWRDNSTFSRHKVSKKSSNKNTEYINNMGKSKYHQDFLRKFVR